VIGIRRRQAAEGGEPPKSETDGVAGRSRLLVAVPTVRLTRAVGRRRYLGSLSGAAAGAAVGGLSEQHDQRVAGGEARSAHGVRSLLLTARLYRCRHRKRMGRPSRR
jgi:hypothetical protein